MRDDLRGAVRVRTACKGRMAGAVLVGVLAAGCAFAETSGSPGPRPGSDRPTRSIRVPQLCAYTANRVDQLAAFGAAIGTPVDCALVFNNAAPGWSDLQQPWFTVHGDPAFNWADWKSAAPGRRLVITQSLVPSNAPPDWRRRGARGAYDWRAKRLARNLIADGLGDSVIRLAHESNGTWTKDGLGDDPAAYTDWSTYWGRFARAMKSVRDSHFVFDWTVNAGTRPIPLDAYYPGDDVVDIVGVDVYDFWDEPLLGPAPADPVTRWGVRYDEPAGTGSVVAFAAAHDKPLSIPEWGLSAVGHKGGAGDNPTFIAGIAGIVSGHDVAYQSYFEATTDVGMLLTDAPRSLAAYRLQFSYRNGGAP